MNNIIVHMNMIIVKTVKGDTSQHTTSGANSSGLQGNIQSEYIYNIMIFTM